MALIRCGECNHEVSDKASTCPNCGAPVDPSTAAVAPETISMDGDTFIATSAQLMELAKKAVGRLNYRVDATDSASGTASFTTGMTMGSWSGVSGTISWVEIAPYRFKVSGAGKQNVQGGQVVAFNLFDEANGKARNVISEMERLARGGSESENPASGCVVLLLGLTTSAVGAGYLATNLI